MLSAMLCSAKIIGTHGSARVDGTPDKQNGKPRTTRTLTRGAESHVEPVSPMPEPELWFEALLSKQKIQISK
jgi:hypothetical protein